MSFLSRTNALIAASVFFSAPAYAVDVWTVGVDKVAVRPPSLPRHSSKRQNTTVSLKHSCLLAVGAA
jgi:hypothetical protein